jgi:hypothetical protein
MRPDLRDLWHVPREDILTKQKALAFFCKGKVAPVLFLTEHRAMKAYWGSGGIAPLIL